MTDHRVVEYFRNPGLEEPVLVMCLEGWIDASNAAALAARELLHHADDDPVATFEADELLDQRARRPVMTLDEGVITGLSWPTTEIRHTTDQTGSDVLLLIGAEPDQRWNAFTESVIDIALELDVRMIVGLGAYPAAVPHTRPTRVAITSASADSTAFLGGFIRGSLEVPTGVQTAIEVAGHEAGVPTLGLWAQVPHYLGGFGFPVASMALIDALHQVTGLHFPVPELADAAVDALRRIDSLVEGQSELAQLVEQLETGYDDTAPGESPMIGDLPSGDDIAAELLEFLRDQDD